MAQLVLDKVTPDLIELLRQRAGQHGVSPEEEHRRILRNALVPKIADEDGDDEFPDLKALLGSMPEVGDDAIFERIGELPRDLDLS